MPCAEAHNKMSNESRLTRKMAADEPEFREFVGWNYVVTHDFICHFGGK